MEKKHLGSKLDIAHRRLFDLFDMKKYVLAVKSWPHNKTVRREKLSTPAGRTPTFGLSGYHPCFTFNNRHTSAPTKFHATLPEEHGKTLCGKSDSPYHNF